MNFHYVIKKSPVALALFCLLSCERIGSMMSPNSYVYFRNDSQEELWIYENFESKYNFPDTTLDLSFWDDLEYYQKHYRNYIQIAPGESSPLDKRKSVELNCTPYYSVYVFSLDTCAVYPLEVVIEQSKYLVRYDLLKSDLEGIGYVISYPPKTEMSDIQMYPVYEEIRD